MKKLFGLVTLLALLAALSAPAALADQIGFYDYSASPATNVDLSSDQRTLTVTYSSFLTTELAVSLTYEPYSGMVNANLGLFSPNINYSMMPWVNVSLWVESGGVPVSPATLYFAMSGDYTLSTTFSHIEEKDLSFVYNEANAEASLSLAGVSKYVPMFPGWGATNYTDAYSFSGSDTGNQYGSTVGLSSSFSWRTAEYAGPDTFPTLQAFQDYFGVSGDSLSATVTTTLSLNMSWTLSLDELGTEPGPGPDPDPASTPEPATILLLGSSLLVGARLRKRFKTGRSAKD